jgi:lysophospholipase L1-like esterase
MRLLPHARFKRLCFALLAILVGLFASVLLAEVLCRIVQGEKSKNLVRNYWPPGSVIYDPAIGWKYRPGYRGRWRYLDEYDCEVAINSLGLRDREFGAKTVPRLLFVGDSFTFGVGVNDTETFVKQTEQILKRKTPVECINAGRVGSATDVYLHYARFGLDALKADVVVVCLFPENDFSETWQFNRDGISMYRDVGGEVYYGDAPLGRERYYRTGPLFRNSALYRFLRLRLARVAIGVNADSFERSYFDIFLKNEPAYMQSATSLVIENLDRIRTLCNNRNASMTLVLLPSIVHAKPELAEYIVNLMGRRKEDYDFGKPFRRLEQYGRDRGIPVLDLRTAFAAQRWPCFFKHDGHFNTRGHRVAGESLAAFLIANRLVPSARQDASRGTETVTPDRAR